MTNVWLLVVKGNLRHRIEILGVEKPSAELSDEQKALRHAATEQRFNSDVVCQFPERPPWANGAFVYLTPEHAADIQTAIDEHGVRLQSKHILVSEELKPILKKVLDAKPDGHNREAFLRRRAGAIEREDIVPFATYSFEELHHMRQNFLQSTELGVPETSAGACNDGVQACRRGNVPGKESILRLNLAKDAKEALERGMNLTPAEKTLLRAAELQNFKCCPPEAPGWAHGALLYLVPGHAAEIQDAMSEHAVSLAPNHVIVSWSIAPIVREVLQARNEVIEREDILPLPTFSHAESRSIRRAMATNFDDQFSCSEESDGSRRTRSTGDRPLGLDEDNVLGLQGAQRLPPAEADYGRARKIVHLLQLSPDVMEQRDVDLELLEFLTAPPSVQKLQPEMWLDAWQHVSRENTWIEMRPHRDCGPCPYCKLCERWVDMPHLMSTRCKDNVATRKMRVGPLLSAILVAEENRLTSSASSRARAEAATSKPRQEDRIEVMSRGVCPKPGCGLPAGGRGSATHCCRRCQAAHVLGVTKLNYDPLTGKAWKKAHGPECTKHLFSTGVPAAAPHVPTANEGLPTALEPGHACPAAGLGALRRMSYLSIGLLSACDWSVLGEHRSRPGTAASLTTSSSDSLPLGADHIFHDAMKRGLAPKIASLSASSDAVRTKGDHAIHVASRRGQRRGDWSTPQRLLAVVGVGGIALTTFLFRFCGRDMRHSVCNV
mmetsp:Transcript_17392/g.47462  ORF Transcript_17392/g.47462 Transcript_17392/m.47462 type:complete len:720 (-) Transcript_17392:152-2311(-)|eukprot:CAMPEP_0117536234 /NCGR_PEP_ID=MMETSP0784-20121206/41347_1 /TAXON_ID=39447 /ORGANISM="" /LENGTH=719 /DNA_ID=CAMNT_0005332789 /DNA_START=59 /DNA_END=2218 /DNA_ORIENTATION=+